MNSSMGKRILSLALSAALALALLPTIVLADDYVCEIGATQYETLAEALDAVTDGDTIKLLQDIDYNKGILIKDISITFDVNGCVLNVLCTDNSLTSYGDALTVNGGQVLLEDSSSEQAGAFNVTSTYSIASGVFAYNGGKAEVTNATGAYYGAAATGGTVAVAGNAVGQESIGVLNNGGTITVGGDVSGASSGVSTSGPVIIAGDVTGGTRGVSASQDAIVTVGGNVLGETYGIFAGGTASVAVEGNVTGGDCGVSVQNSASVTVAGDVMGGTLGVHAYHYSSYGAQVTIEGELQTADSGNYIGLGYRAEGDLSPKSYKAQGDGVPSASKPGYLEYTDGISTVWVKGSLFVCEIVGGEKYTDLADALAAVASGQTIKLLRDIDYNTGIIIQSKTITFDVNGYILNVTSGADSALSVIGGNVQLTDSSLAQTGQLNVTSTGGVFGSGVYANSGRVTVTNATGAYAGVYATGNARVSVNGDASGNTMGVYANNHSIVEVQGNVLGTACGVEVTLYTATVVVEGRIIVPPSGDYVKISGIATLLQSAGIPSVSRPGYLQYTNRIAELSFVYVRDPDYVPDPVCEIVETGVQYPLFFDAWCEVEDGQTLRLLDDIEYNDNLRNGNISFTIDVNGYTLLVAVATGDAIVISDGEMLLADSSEQKTGAFNVSADHGLGIFTQGTGNGTIEVTNATGASLGAGAHASGTLIVHGDAVAIGSTGIGASANVGAATVVEGDVVALGASGIGVFAALGGTVTVEGTITSGGVYIKIGSTEMGPDDHETTSTKTGYLEYTDGESFVWVKAALSADAGLSSVAGQAITAGAQAGTQTAPKTATVSAADTKVTIGRSDIEVAADATFNLYSNAAFSAEITDTNTIALTAGGATTVYIKVTAQDGTTVLHYAVTVNRAATPTYALTVSAGAGGTVSGTATGMYEAGTAISVTAVTEDGYVFAGWAMTGDVLHYPTVLLMENPLTFSMPADAVSLMAHFAPDVSPTFSISLNVSGTHIFANAIAGYGAQAPLTVTVTNTGNQPTGELTLALSKAGAAGAFELSASPLGSIAVGQTDSFTVVPKTGLAAGTYSTTVAVSGGNGISETFDVSFKVWHRGDANEDGLVNAADAAAILRHLVRLTTLTDQGLLNAKVTDGPGQVSAADAAKILRWLVRLEKEL